MKPSHFRTPRTMEDSTWYAWGAPIERPWKPVRSMSTIDAVFCGLAVAIFASAVAIILWR